MCYLCYRLLRLVVLPLLALIGPIASWADEAQPPRRLVIIDGADFFGLDYDTLQDVTQAQCEQACLGDTRCGAFTFNRNAGWCFLKRGHGQLRAFDGAVSGRIVTGAPDAADALAMRRSELAFLPSGYRDEADGLRERVAAAGDRLRRQLRSDRRRCPRRVAGG